MSRVTKPPEERRAELVSAARRLFDKKGVDKTRVSDIVKSVGLAQGAFYYYFQSKEEIVRAVTDQVEEELRAQASGILQRRASFPVKLRAYIGLHLRLMDQFLGDDEPNTSALLMANALATGSALPATEDSPGQRARQLLQEMLLTLVDQAVAGGELAVPWPRETALVLVEGLEAYARQQLPGRPLIYSLCERAFGLPPDSLAKPAKFNTERNEDGHDASQ